MSEFKQYKRKQIAELRPYEVGSMLSDKVSISEEDLKAGSPKEGDMIARNPKNHDDQWLVAKQYFEDNFEPLHTSEPGKDEKVELYTSIMVATGRFGFVRATEDYQILIFWDDVGETERAINLNWSLEKLMWWYGNLISEEAYIIAEQKTKRRIRNILGID